MSLVFYFERQRLLYLAVPKAANVAIRTWLLPFVTNRTADEINDILYGVEWPTVSRAEFFRSPRQDLLAFSVVRNPWARVASAYRDKICRPTAHRALAEQGFETYMPFMDFLDHMNGIPDEKIDVHLRSQWSFLTSLSGKFLPNIVLDVSQLGILPALVNAHCATGLPPTIPQRNQNRSQVPLEQMLPGPSEHARFRDMIGSRFEWEIRFFGYKYPY